ncbi:MAG: gliding motility-associated C-terminal domain-containing protein [Bacteroidales bacterium]|nr:gliding motility-associated C-terminal domain-containing protein [Bacteroidales bacterium]
MIRNNPYRLISGIVLFITLRVTGQMTMPDTVFVGQTRQYYVDPGPGSIYTWWIDGVVQPGFTSNEFEHTWNSAKTYLLEVLETSAAGCPGTVRSGLVYVNPEKGISLIIPEAFSPNGDLINDFWNIGNINLYPALEIYIYNRWGQMVWKSGRGYPIPWDGRSEGSELPSDSYHYLIDLPNGNKPVTGSITILK